MSKRGGLSAWLARRSTQLRPYSRCRAFLPWELLVKTSHFPSVLHIVQSVGRLNDRRNQLECSLQPWTDHFPRGGISMLGIFLDDRRRHLLAQVNYGEGLA